MTSVLLVLVALGIGLAVGFWYASPRQFVADALARRSRVLYELAEGDLDNVARELEAVAEAEPADSTVFLALAALDRRRGRIERAKMLHRTVLASARLDPEHRVAALVGLGRDLLAQGNDRAATGALIRAVSLAPRSVATLESLARALEEAGAWDRAAATWERHEKLVEGRRRRASRQGRGHALAGHAAVALAEGDDRKARRLADRATDLASDSGHVWTTKARIEASTGDAEAALQAWQRAWESAPAGAHVLVPEAWRWAAERDLQASLVERMLASLRTTPFPHLAVALAERVSRQHFDQTTTLLERHASHSLEAALALIRARLTRGQSDQAREIAMQPFPPPALFCGECGQAMARFTFRCERCGAWDSAQSPAVAESTPPRAPERPAGAALEPLLERHA